jgi:hypothetical protein
MRCNALQMKVQVKRAVVADTVAVMLKSASVLLVLGVTEKASAASEPAGPAAVAVLADPAAPEPEPEGPEPAAKSVAQTQSDAAAAQQACF